DVLAAGMEAPQAVPAPWARAEPWRLPSALEDCPRSDAVSYVLRIEGRPYTIHLQQRGSLSFVMMQGGCHYRGYIEGFPSSAVTLSTCSGLRGLLQFENVSYGIEPLGYSPAFEHFVYRVSDERTAGSLLANSHPESGPGRLIAEMSTKARGGDEVSIKSHVIFQYDYLGADEYVVTQKIIQVSSLLSSMFSSLNLTVMLSSMEVWMDNSTFKTMGNGEEVLAQLLEWKQTSPILQPHEVPYLLLYRDQAAFMGATAPGKACQRDAAGARGPLRWWVRKDGEKSPFCLLCQFKQKNSPCRPTADAQCDLAEFCNGSSASCPPDLYVQDGHGCEHGTGYCYKGRCQSPDLQCQALYGKGAKNAPLACYEEVNHQQDRFGHCGNHPKDGYQPCSWPNLGCGKLVCTYPNRIPFTKVKGAIIYAQVQEHLCVSFDFMRGPTAPDPLLVKEGTKCGPGKVCMNGTCHPHSVLKYDCNVQKKCHGHGVSNSNKNCHCNPGWKPPQCKIRGSFAGGSIDSMLGRGECRSWALGALWLYRVEETSKQMSKIYKCRRSKTKGGFPGTKHTLCARAGGNRFPFDTGEAASPRQLTRSDVQEESGWETELWGAGLAQNTGSLRTGRAGAEAPLRLSAQPRGRGGQRRPGHGRGHGAGAGSRALIKSLGGAACPRLCAGGGGAVTGRALGPLRGRCGRRWGCCWGCWPRWGRGGWGRALPRR
uniref:ADAM metallopeptidase domain 32 n=1 Tax=Accipiter nisus TaxID=211598 RepID=A0A8B9NVS7_9AVES